MLKNDFVKDIDKLCDEEEVSKVELAERLGILRQSVYKVAHRKVVTQSFIDLCDALGYDVEIIYRRQKM